MNNYYKPLQTLYSDTHNICEYDFNISSNFENSPKSVFGGEIYLFCHRIRLKECENNQSFISSISDIMINVFRCICFHLVQVLNGDRTPSNTFAHPFYITQIFV